MALWESTGRGAFIVIEGLDRSGKTTQVKRIEAELSRQGRKVKMIRFPDRTTTIGQMINNYLQSKSNLEDHVIHLLFSANRWELAKSIEDDIARGHTIVCDRFTYSGMVYSAAKGNSNLSLGWAREPDVGLPRPDLVIFLNLDIDEAEKRGGYGDEKYEKRELQQRVQRLFLDLESSKEEEADDMVIINASGSIEAVGDKILDVIQMKLALVDNGSAGTQIRRIGKWRQRGGL